MKDVQNEMHFIDIVQLRKSKSFDEKGKTNKNIFSVMQRGEIVDDYK